MLMLRLFIYGSCLLLLAGACMNNTSPEPEEVVTAYINKLHRSDFDGAAAFCTPAGVAYVEALKAIMADPEALPDTSSVVINQILCEPLSVDSIMRCEVMIDDGFEVYAEQYLLRQSAKGWLIDHQPQDGETSASEEVISTEEKPAVEN
jgi:hypothetical protein